MHNTLDINVITIGRYVPDATKKTYIYPGTCHGVKSLVPSLACGGLVGLFMDDAHQMKGKMLFFGKDSSMEIFREVRDNLDKVSILVTKTALFLMDTESARDIEKMESVTTVR